MGGRSCSDRHTHLTVRALSGPNCSPGEHIGHAGAHCVAPRVDPAQLTSNFDRPRWPGLCRVEVDPGSGQFQHAGPQDASRGVVCAPPVSVGGHVSAVLVELGSRSGQHRRLRWHERGAGRLEARLRRTGYSARPFGGTCAVPKRSSSARAETIIGWERRSGRITDDRRRASGGLIGRT